MNIKEWISYITSDFDIPKLINDEWILEQFNSNNDMFVLWGFCYRNLRDYDLRNISKDLLLRIPFDSSTLWPELLPCGFNPYSILENKKLGYGFRDVHKSGITGKGVLIAVIDHPSNIDHIEIKDNLKEYVILDEKYNLSHFHGLAVLSHLCGRKLGIAPDAEVIFYGAQPYEHDENDKLDGNIIIDFGIKCLKDIKNRIKNGQLIRIINMSSSWLHKGSYELKQKASNLILELKELGCVLIDSTVFWNNFSYLDCKANQDYDNIDNYYTPSFFKKDIGNLMNFLSGGKLIPSYLTQDNYIFEPEGCASYSIPQLSGFYALGLQVNPELKYNDFVAFCFVNSIVNKSGLRILNPVGTLEAIKQNKIK